MTKQETVAIMALFRAAYPRYYQGMDDQGIHDAINLWYTMLKEYDPKIVGMAVKAVIATCKFPPTIAEIVEKINLLQNGEQMDELTAWSHVQKAIRNSTYHANEEWEALPEQIKKAVSPDLLRSWAGMEADSLTVIQSHFSRCFRSAAEREKERQALPENVRTFLDEKTGHFKMEEIENKH